MHKTSLWDRFLAMYSRSGWHGFHRLHSITGKKRIFMKSSYGSSFALDPHDYIDHIVLQEGYYESEVLEALLPFMKKGAVFWDIGSNFGLHAVTVKHRVPDVTVHAFEPNPVVFQKLILNISSNDVDITAWPMALSDSNGTGQLHSIDEGNPGMSTLQPWSEAHYDRVRTVPLARAEVLILNDILPLPTVLKIDVEGNEAAVLAGFGNYLADPKLQAIVIEARGDLHQNPGADRLGQLLIDAELDVITPLSRNEDSAHSLSNFLVTRKKATA